MVRFVIAVLLIAAAPSITQAQTLRLTTGLAGAGYWDDETHLGNGVLMAAGVSMLPVDALRLEAELAIAHHNRDAGYLAASGTPLAGIVRAAWRIGGARWRARPFLSAGASLTHSRGTLKSPEQERDWRFTKPGLEFGAGIEIRGARQMWWRPEVRVSGTSGDNGYTPGRSTLELPMISIRSGLTVIW
ncbi:MAG: hypothetical protein AB7L71_01265 [Vicinamibacterales bacterium]